MHLLPILSTARDHRCESLSVTGRTAAPTNCECIDAVYMSNIDQTYVSDRCGRLHWFHPAHGKGIGRALDCARSIFLMYSAMHTVSCRIRNDVQTKKSIPVQGHTVLKCFNPPIIRSNVEPASVGGRWKPLIRSSSNPSIAAW